MEDVESSETLPPRPTYWVPVIPVMWVRRPNIESEHVTL